MIEAGLCRGVVNQRIGRIKRMFRWAVENELVPAAVLHGLQAVAGLQRGRSPARETEPIKPVPEPFVTATLPHVRPQVAAMIQLQLLAGMRPGELVIMRAIDIDMTSKVWLYRPGSDQGPEGVHKTSYRGHQRIIPIGPRGQEIVRRYLKPNVNAYLFSPREAVDQLRVEQRQRRKTKVQPSQINTGGRLDVCPCLRPVSLRVPRPPRARRRGGVPARRPGGSSTRSGFDSLMKCRTVNRSVPGC